MNTEIIFTGITDKHNYQLVKRENEYIVEIRYLEIGSTNEGGIKITKFSELTEAINFINAKVKKYILDEKDSKQAQNIHPIIL